MITKIENYTENYASLFKQAEQTLGLSEGTIDSLEAYYVNLPQLFSEDEKFTILPLQEEIIPINANTRTISIPAGLKNIGVAGDNGAEFLFFIIDRYFDAQDLAASDITTVVDWVANGETGIDPILFRTTEIPSYYTPSNKKTKNNVDGVEIEGSKILICWAPSENATATAGTLQFSLRFYQTNEEKLLYSFATQPATVTISKTLAYDISDKIDDDFNIMIKNRILNMQSPGIGGLIKRPEFYLNLNEIPDANKAKESPIKSSSGAIVSYAADLNIEDGVATYYTAKVAAKNIEGTYIINYIWQKKANNGWVNITSDDVESYAAEAYELVSYDENLDIVYYESDGDKYIISAEPSTTTKPLYARYSYANLNTVGEYRVIAQIKTTNASATTDSYVLTILGPTKPVIEGERTSNSIKLIENTDETSEDYGSFNANISINRIGEYDESNLLSYAWYKSTKADDYLKTDVSGIEFESLELNKNNTYAVSEEYWYKGQAVHQRNNSELSYSDSKYFRVTKPAQVPKYEFLNNQLTTGTGPVTFEIPLADQVPFDDISFEVYKFNADSNVSDLVGEAIATITEYTESSEGSKYVFTVPVPEAGKPYGFKIVNKFNNDIIADKVYDASGKIFTYIRLS